MKEIKALISLTLILFSSSCSLFKEDENYKKNFCQEAKSALGNIGSPKTLFVITSESISDSNGSLEILKQKRGGLWKREGDPIEVMIGRSGMGLGYPWRHLQNYLNAPLKKEGDGKTPMGIHLLGPKFGFKEASFYDQDENYQVINKSTVCVDDSSSKYYNRIIDSDPLKIKDADWNSAEQMIKEPLYDQGIEIKYMSNAESKSGSCIFLHLVNKALKGTSGCIAMEKILLDRLYKEAKNNTSVAIIIMQRAQYLEHRECMLN